MYVLATISLKEAMEYGSSFSFIITFATFCDANDALLEKSNWFLCLAWQCVRPVTALHRENKTLFGILSGMCATLPHPTWMSL